MTASGEQLVLLTPGQPGACDADCEICEGAERSWGWARRRGDRDGFAVMNGYLHQAKGRLAEAYARARGDWP